MDKFSLAGLRLARLKWLQSVGTFVINYDTPLISNGERMGDTTIKTVQQADIVFQECKLRTFNAITVVQSHAQHCLADQRKSILVVSAPEISAYFRAVAQGVEKAYCPGWKWEVISPHDAPRANAKSTRWYKTLAPVTNLFAKTGVSFRFYAGVRNFIDRRRERNIFVGTLAE